MSNDKPEKVVGQLPPRGTMNTEWDKHVATARQYPNQAVEIATGVREVTVNSLRQYVRRAPYATPEGHVEINLRNSKVDDDGIRRGTVFFTWIPSSNDKESEV